QAVVLGGDNNSDDDGNEDNHNIKATRPSALMVSDLVEVLLWSFELSSAEIAPNHDQSLRQNRALTAVFLTAVFVITV
ncbi:hypothetical protein, partial [Acinetobacter baumannii]